VAEELRAAIFKVEGELEQVASKIEGVERAIEVARREKAEGWQVEVAALRRKEEQLRRKEELLREEKARLMARQDALAAQAQAQAGEHTVPHERNLSKQQVRIRVYSCVGACSMWVLCTFARPGNTASRLHHTVLCTTDAHKPCLPV
jgi:hypothetical protein